MSNPVAITTSCYHCGDPCETDQIEFDDKSFCCAGCKTVYEILSENDLCDYYDLEANPGVSQSNQSNGLFEYLENAEVKRQLLDFSDGEQEKVTLFVPNIHCSSCIWLLEHLDRLAPQVIHANVNFTQRKVSIHYKTDGFSLKQLAELLHRIGYGAVINLEAQEDAEQVHQADKKLWVKLGVAGFCFGNVMLLSFPEYLGLSELEREYQTIFRWISALMAVPVVFYAASDYFISAFKSLRQRFINIDVPIALGIITLFVRSFYEVAANVGSGYFDSLVSLIFFLLIGKWFQHKTYRNLSFDRDYKSYFPLAVLRKKDNAVDAVMVKDIKKGDELIIRNTEVVPADAILIDGEASIDYSFVTGESAAVEKVKGDLVYAGGRLVGKQAHFIAQKDVSQSYLTSLWNDQAFEKERKSKRLIDQVSQYFTVIIMLVATGAAVYWQQVDPSKTWLVFTAVLIVACPCALALATPFTWGSVLRVFSRNQFYLKNADIIEDLQKIDTIVFDKTGTITETASQDLEFVGEPLTEGERAMTSMAVASSTHPLSRRVNQSLKASGSAYSLEQFDELSGKGVFAVVSGVEVKLGSAKFVGAKASEAAETSEVFLSIGGKVRGRFLVKNTYRKGFKALVDDLAAHFKLSVLSGDNEAEKERLQTLLPEGTSIRFQQSPHNKLQVVKGLQTAGANVMMMGDGLNDAGALKQSNVGVAVTEDISMFSPASDAIMHANAFGALSKLMALVKQAKWVVIASFVISFMYNIGGLTFAVAGWLTPLFAAILMPLSSISVVLFTTLIINWLGKRKGL
ncbi:heavy metal translocating P-type ATPase [Roseivirga pacifica]|uniref:heavy metal translocating P-type ATPase n=1 Tax=Roseivirga pacifica TaxID=1267423 RepID=UPI002094807D|nr:heavy metal translocating P-type ATPase metal-binding domain-containing protein [Roseivirga pacifica]MCO6357759.1 HAD-IC family P-type ATPase [Roseivirga pacifica]MCO6366012.1 HAD-IC family P-type ATPase [Roseivirga pacifica]MCO6371340.1 HAD-IC family P-type ATPase [Roseivirga pacifica]MCO6375489.1 HAD-IC family P-type ATPase [Roseivirga pacifica]MCO6378718.1 HAD-IC family P-type ATPase [Roseivirga pacifica]